jgi:uncharacterized protein YecT (DUF1311 family)
MGLPWLATGESIEASTTGQQIHGSNRRLGLTLIARGDGMGFLASLVDHCQFTRVVFAAQIAFGCSLLVSGAAAQDEKDPPPAPPPQAVFQHSIPREQLAFLNDYAGRTAKELKKDKRFRQLMKLVVPRTEFHYGHDMPLDEAIDTVLDGAPLPIDIREGRYVMVASHGGPYLNGKGFVWLDMQAGIALGGFFFHPVNGEPTPTLAVFSRQLKTDSLTMSQLPLAFAQDLNQWVAVAGVRPIFTRYFIPDDGKKYVLMHDEDYCVAPPGATTPDQQRCEQMNYDAANIDLNAADFMAQTHNAANATAWMLSPEQVSWIAVRTRTCGGGLACSIRLTRERTRVLIGQHS